jgi:hypothetical protein
MPESKPRTQKAAAGSVFDRLYKTQTAASRSRQKTHRAAARAWNPKDRNAASIHRTPTKSLGTDDCSKIFTRLHITTTVSNTSKRVQPRHPTTPAKTARSPLPRTPAKTPSTKPGEGFVYSPVSFDSSHRCTCTGLLDVSLIVMIKILNFIEDEAPYKIDFQVKVSSRSWSRSRAANKAGKSFLSVLL